MNPEKEEDIHDDDSPGGETSAQEPAGPPPFLSLLRHAALYGGTGGAIAAVWMIVFYPMALHAERGSLLRYTPIVMLVIPIVAFMLGTIRWRDRALGGTIRFSQAFGIALAIGASFALAAAIGEWLFAVIAPDAFSAKLEAIAQGMVNNGAPDADIVAWRQTAGTPVGSARGVFSFWLTVSLVISLMIALVMRKRPLPGAS